MKKELIIFAICVSTFSYWTGWLIGSNKTVELDTAPVEDPMVEELTMEEVGQRAKECLKTPLEIEEMCQIPPEEEIVEVESETYTITAYCSCHECCGKWANNRPLDESGKPIVIGSGCVPLVQGVHCASALANGTVIEIEGLGMYEVQDSVSQRVLDKYDDKIIDIYFSNHEEAEKFGKRECEVKILYAE